MNGRLRVSASLLAMLALSACGGDSTGSGGGGGGGGGGAFTSAATVHLTSASYSPSVVNLNKGGVITWTADTNVEHTITPDAPGQAGAWASTGMDASGQTFSHTFNTAGDFAYHCNIHSTMKGVIHVQ